MPARWRRALAVATAFALAISASATGSGAEPTRVALERLASDAGAGARFDLAYTGTFRMPVSGRQVWAGKFVDRASGQVRAVYVDGATALDPTELAARERAELAALTAFERKADRALREARAQRPERLPVSLWLEADASAAVEAVFARHPGVPRIGDRPDTDDPTLARVIRDELYGARAAVYAEAAARAAALIRAQGGRTGYASSSAPLLFADLPLAALDALAGRDEVLAMGAADPGGWSESMAYAGPTVKADWAYSQGYRGSGTRVAVVEYFNVRNSGDLSGKVVASYSTSGSLKYDNDGLDHPTWVAGAVAGQSSTWRGTAPAASIVSAATGGWTNDLSGDQAIIAAADWAVGTGKADVVNTSLVQDTATGREQARRYFDAIGWEASRVPVSAAGNYANFNSWNVGSPGTGWNVLTVGGTDERNTASWKDDVLWATSTNGSCYRDPAGTAWNPHGDFNKPNVSAPAVTVRTANGLSATGTSVATPITAGVVAGLIGRNATFVNWPEIPRALVMAGAIHHTPTSSGSTSRDREGVGTVVAEWSHRILDGSQYGGYTYGTLGSGGTTTTFSVAKGQNVRVVLAWSSRTSGSMLSKVDALTADLDLRVTFPDGATKSSLTFDNNYEFVEYTPGAGGTATIQVGATRFDATSEDFALAWVRWPTVTEDTQAPTAPTGLAAVVTSPTSVALSWTKSTDDVGVAGYRVSRNGSVIATVTSTEYTDGGLSPETKYDYAVAAFDAAGNVSPPATVSVTTPGPDTAPPSAPTNLAAAVLKSGVTKLTWTASTDDVAVTGYHVYQNDGLHATTTGTSLSIRKVRGTFSYFVVAFDAAGNVSAPSNTVTVTIR